MEIKNCTPHPIFLLDDDNNLVLTLDKCDTPPRLKQSTFSEGNVLVNGVDIPLTKTLFGETKNLPDEQEGVLLVVSRIVLSANAHRRDMVVPNDIVRDINGRIIGCKSFAKN